MTLSSNTILFLENTTVEHYEIATIKRSMLRRRISQRES